MASLPIAYTKAYLYEIDVLYFAFKASGQSEEKFITEHQTIIDSVIDDFQSGRLVNRNIEE